MVTSERARAAGLRRIPRRHVAEPGEVKLSDGKVRVTMYLDADVLEYFKGRRSSKTSGSSRPSQSAYRGVSGSDDRSDGHQPSWAQGIVAGRGIG